MRSSTSPPEAEAAPDRGASPTQTGQEQARTQPALVRAQALVRSRAGDLAGELLLVVAESTWAALVLSAIAAGSRDVAPTFPLLAVAGVAATLLMRMVRRSGVVATRTRRARRALLWASALVGVWLTAALVATLWAGAWGGAALRPWGLGAPLVPALGATVRWAWTLAALCWARGAWLAGRPPTIRHATASLVLGSCAFVAVFAARTSGGGALAAATSAAGWLLFVFFPVGLTAAAWLHEAALERTMLRRHARPGATWLGILLVPLALVALVALGLGESFSAAGGPLGRAAAATADGFLIGAQWVVQHVVGALWAALLHHRSHGRPHTGLPARATKAGARSHPNVLADVGAVVLIGVVCIACVAAVSLLVTLVARLVRRLWRWLRRPAPHAAEDPAAEERDSLFTWRHLLEQLGRVLRTALFRLLRHRPGAPSVATGRRPAALPGDPVRAAYATFLGAARRAGAGRTLAETPLELAARLQPSLSTEPAALRALGSLTEAYGDVRYGERAPAAAAVEGASSAAELLALRWRAPLSPARRQAP